MTPLKSVVFVDGTSAGAAQLTTRDANAQGGAVKLTADYERRIVIVERPKNAKPIIHVPMERCAHTEPAVMKTKDAKDKDKP